MGQKDLEGKKDRLGEADNVNSFKNVFNGEEDSLRCLYTNADQLKNKMDEMETRIREYRPHIVGITEVKAKNSQRRCSPAEYNMVTLNNYDMFGVNLDSDKGRGLILYVDKQLGAIEVKIESSFQEFLTIRIGLSGGRRLMVALVYRSEGGGEENNMELLETINKICQENFEFTIIMGDFNYPGIDWGLMEAKGHGNNTENKFLECIQDNYLFQLVGSPTRWRGDDKPNLLDLILTNEEGLVESLEIQSPLGKSDHCVIAFNIKCQREQHNNFKIRKNYNKANYTEIRNKLNEIPWDEQLSARTTEESWNYFTAQLNNIIDKFVPETKYKNRKENFPLDAETVNKIKLKNALSRKFIKTRKPEDRAKYNKVRNQVSKLTKRARKDFERNLTKEAKENPKKIWKYINSRSKLKVGIGELYTDPNDTKSHKTNNNKEKANILNDFFQSVFTNEPEGEVPSLGDKTKTGKKPWMKLKICRDNIAKILKSLKPDKSPGMDNINPRLLRETAEEIAKPLQLIFNKSLEERRIPTDWKKAKVSAIFKKGDKCYAGNYRPVSLTSVVCKVMERLVRDHIIEYMSANKLFTKRQYGFMSGRSTSLQLIRVLEEWTEALDRGQQVHCIYMDYQKAFDTVPHKRLLSKIKSYGVGDELNKWIQDFLTDREQYVDVLGEGSDWADVTSGIPQGSVLGPLLFVMYINDLPDLVSSTVYLFADDTKIFKIIENENDPKILQRDLDSLRKWSDTWLLRFHPQKCKFMNLGKNKEQVEYKLGDHRLDQISEEKDIGVHIDDELSFNRHISEKIKKANSMAGIIRRSFKYLDKETFTPLYKSLVRTHLEYASSVWAPYKIKHVEDLEAVQRRATRQLPGMSGLNYEERLRKLGLPTLAFRRLRGDMIEIYKLTNKIYDAEVCDFVKTWDKMAPREGNRGHSKKLYPQRAKSNLRKNALMIRAVRTWNSLPEKVVSARTVNSFKNQFDKLMKDQDIMYNDYRAEVRITGSIVSDEYEEEEYGVEEPNSGPDP